MKYFIPYSLQGVAGVGCLLFCIQKVDRPDALEPVLRPGFGG